VSEGLYCRMPQELLLLKVIWDFLSVFWVVWLEWQERERFSVWMWDYVRDLCLSPLLFLIVMEVITGSHGGWVCSGS